MSKAIRIHYKDAKGNVVLVSQAKPLPCKPIK